jgi:hypothetical protein
MALAQNTFRTAGGRNAKLPLSWLYFLWWGQVELPSSQERKYSQDPNADKRMTLLLKDFDPRPCCMFPCTRCHARNSR